MNLRRTAQHAGCLLFGFFAQSHCDDGVSRRVYPESSLVRARAASAAVDPARLRAHVVAMNAAHQADTPERPTWGAGATFTHLRSAAYVREQFTALGYTPTVESANNDGLDTQNVWAEIRGATRPDELVLVTAHHDAWWQSGSDDNASGVAIVLEAARVLKDTRPSRTLRFVAFDREEEGLIGANRYAAAHNNERVVMVVNMDCVGFASEEPGSQNAPLGLALRSVGNFLLVAANDSAGDALARFVRYSASDPMLASVVGVIVPDDGHYPVDSSFLRSDHTPFWRRGVPALFLTDTANFRNRHYHTPQDTPDTVSMPFLERVGRLTIGAAAAFAETE